MGFYNTTNQQLKWEGRIINFVDENFNDFRAQGLVTFESKDNAGVWLSVCVVVVWLCGYVVFCAGLCL